MKEKFAIVAAAAFLTCAPVRADTIIANASSSLTTSCQSVTVNPGKFDQITLPMGATLECELSNSGSNYSAFSSAEASSALGASPSVYVVGHADASGGTSSLAQAAAFVQYTMTVTLRGEAPPDFDVANETVPLDISAQGGGSASGTVHNWTAGFGVVGRGVAYSTSGSFSGTFGAMVFIGETYQVGVDASCDAGGYGDPEHPEMVDAARCSAAADPTFSFDQAEFDALRGSATFPLADYFAVQLSPNLDAANDTVTAIAGQPIAIDALANDVGFTDPVTVSIVADPSKGGVVVSGSPGPISGIRFLYAPNANAAGPDTFVYSVSDGDGSLTATVLITVLADTDADAVADVQDNCTNVSNFDQLDADVDGYGNLCDADLNNSGLVTATDFNLLRSVLNQPYTASALAAAADMNGSGLVTATDFNLLRARMNTAPGPSGVVP